MSDKKLSSPVVGVGVLVWRGRKLLLGRRISENRGVCWQFPGGHLEKDESVLQCAAREVLEETGLKIKALRHFGFTNKIFSVGHRQYITLFVSCDYEAGEAQVRESDKCEVWQWFDYKNLPTPLFRPIEIFISQHSGVQQEDLYGLHRISSPVSEHVPL